MLPVIRTTIRCNRSWRLRDRVTYVAAEFKAWEKGLPRAYKTNLEEVRSVGKFFFYEYVALEGAYD